MSESKTDPGKTSTADESQDIGAPKPWKTVFDPTTSILEIRISGTVDLEVLQAMALAIGVQADIVNPLGILADYSNATLALEFDEVFDLPARAPEFGVAASFPVAIITDPHSHETASFAEDVFTNRGYVYKAFQEKDAAVAWLLLAISEGETSWKQA